MDNTPHNTPTPPPMEEESTGLGHTNMWLIGGGIVVVLLLLGGAAWYAITAWIQAPSTVVPVVTISNENANMAPIPVTNNTVETEGVGKTLIVDEETRRRLAEEASAALRASQAIAGSEGPRIFTGKIANHMEHLRRMRNYLFINVQSLLQGNVNKEKLLSDYMNTLLAEVQEARNHVAAIKTDVALLNTDFTSYQADQKRFQDAYRQAITNYDPVGTAENLEKYIAAQTMAAETFARMRSLQTMGEIYGKILAATDTKMKFIAANKEALLKEVQVVDIKSLEEKLILSEKEWLQQLQ